MSMFGAKYLWHLRLSQGFCGMVGLVLIISGGFLFSDGPGFATIMGASGCVAVVSAFLIEKALRDIEETDRLRTSDSADIADLARSAVQSVWHASTDGEILTREAMALTSTSNQTLETQKNRAKIFEKAGFAIEGLRKILQEASSINQKHQEDFLRRAASVRTHYADLRKLSNEAAATPIHAKPAIQSLVGCKTSTLNLGLEVASVVGDHPAFFAAANKVIGDLTSTIDLAEKAIVEASAPRSELEKKILDLEGSLNEQSKIAIEFEKIARLLIDMTETAAAYPNQTTIRSLAGIRELEGVTCAADALSRMIATFATAQDRGLSVATRAMSVIDRAGVRRNLITTRVPIQSIPAISPPRSDGYQQKTSADIGVDLSPAGELAMRNEAKDQFEIATQGRTVA